MDKNNNLKVKETSGNIPQSAASLFEQVRQKIILVRDCQVILDADVAELYGVETKRVNEAVRNNPDKFPETYMFEIDKQELAYLRSKNSLAQGFHGERLVHACHHSEKQAGGKRHIRHNRDFRYCAPTKKGAYAAFITRRTPTSNNQKCSTSVICFQA